MKLDMYQVDAFSKKAFGGNPAAVCPLDEWLPDELMQSIALENQLSETAFFVREGNEFHLRWFTPAFEIDLCGHATLASAHVLYQHLGYKGSIVFHTRSGPLYVEQEGAKYFMKLPSRPPEKATGPANVVEALGIKPIESRISRDYFFVFESEQQIRDMQPNLDLIYKWEEVVGVTVTAPGVNSDFVSRFFAPRALVNEDPVTGSAHCNLVPYWAEKLGKKKLYAEQLSARYGELFCEDLGEQISLGGNAVTFFKGTVDLSSVL
ncbi:MAG: PhzF family phenazine biosynthesis protein [Bacteroidota bacterium]